jgi:proteasome lid subunit RPN8/RPN11
MLKLRQAEYDDIRRHAEETYPNECCGMLLGTQAVDKREVRATVRCANGETDSPQNRYTINPSELIRVQRQARERRLDIIGFYHSHPDREARWSPTDFDEAHWIGCSYVITSVEQGKAALTNSFVLTGTVEEDKALMQEQVVVE